MSLLASICKPREHHANHGNLDHRLAPLDRPLIVSSQTTISIEPTECAFHDPTVWQDLETFGMIRTFHDIEHTSTGHFDSLNEFTCVPAISPNASQTGEASWNVSQHQLGSVPILDRSSVNDNDEQETQRIHQEVSLSPFYPFARIVASLPTHLSRFHALTL